MLDYADLIARMEKQPISEPNHANARMNYEATDAHIDQIVRSLYWLREHASAFFVGLGTAPSKA